MMSMLGELLKKSHSNRAALGSVQEPLWPLYSIWEKEPWK